MRIVDTDNFAGDYPDEKFLSMIDSNGNAHPISFSEREAETVAEALNKYNGGYSPRYWKVVSDDYKLSPGFEP